MGEMVIPSFSLPLFFQQLLPHDTTGQMIGSMLSPPPGSVSWLVMTFCMFNLGNKKIRIFFPCSVLGWLNNCAAGGKGMGSGPRRWWSNVGAT